MQALRIGLVGLMSLALHACGEATYCEHGALQGALDRAQPGEVVGLGACLVEGPLHVPPGVILRGEDRGRSRIAGALAPVVITLEGILENLSVESAGVAAVHVRHLATARLRGVDMQLESGLGLVAQEAGLTLEDVRVTGMVTASNASHPELLLVTPSAAHAALESACSGPPTCTPGSTREGVLGTRICDACGDERLVTSTHGIVALGGRLEMTNVLVRGTASFAFASVDAEVHASMLHVEGALGAGVYVSGGTSAFTDSVITGTLAGARGTPAIALAAQDVSLTTRGLSLTDNARFGLVQSEGSSQHFGFEGSRNGDSAMWVDAVSAFALEDARFIDNVANSVIITRSPVALSRVSVVRTRLATRVFDSMPFRVGDGVIVRAASDAQMRDVTLSDNERVGLLIELTGDAFPYAFTNVVSEGSGAAFGALAGLRRGSVLDARALSAWPMGVERRGDVAINDAMPGAFALTPDLAPSIASATSLAGIVMPIM